VCCVRALPDEDRTIGHDLLADQSNRRAAWKGDNTLWTLCGVDCKHSMMSLYTVPGVLIYADACRILSRLRRRGHLCDLGRNGEILGAD